MDLMRRAQALARTQVELRSEIATSLGRVGRAIDRALAGLTAIESRLAQLDEEALVAARADHARLRAQAQKQLWYLVVQREALGVSRHDDLLRHYPLPPPLE